MEDLIKKNFEFYKANATSIQKEYKGKFIVIKDMTIVFSHAELSHAIEFSKNFDEGTFIIQNCSETEGRTFHSRVVVKNGDFAASSIHI